MLDRKAADLAFIRHAIMDIDNVIISYPIELNKEMALSRDEIVSHLNSSKFLLRVVEGHISSFMPSDYD